MDLTDYCIGGMHLSGNSMQNIASSKQIVKLAQGLKATKTNSILAIALENMHLIS